MVGSNNRAGQFFNYHGHGQPPGRMPAYQEGEKLELAWSYPDEVAAVWKRYRPSIKGAIPIPSWIRSPLDGLNDFVLDGRLHVAVLGVRGHLVAVTGVDPEPEKFTSWGTCRYTTVFIETFEARTRLTPKYATLKPTVWDRVASDPV
jgi:hypothetical protein